MSSRDPMPAARGCSCSSTRGCRFDASTSSMSTSFLLRSLMSLRRASCAFTVRQGAPPFIWARIAAIPSGEQSLCDCTICGPSRPSLRANTNGVPIRLVQPYQTAHMSVLVRKVFGVAGAGDRFAASASRGPARGPVDAALRRRRAADRGQRQRPWRRRLGRGADAFSRPRRHNRTGRRSSQPRDPRTTASDRRQSQSGPRPAIEEPARRIAASARRARPATRPAWPPCGRWAPTAGSASAGPNSTAAAV